MQSRIVRISPVGMVYVAKCVGLLLFIDPAFSTFLSSFYSSFIFFGRAFTYLRKTKRNVVVQTGSP